MKRRVCKDCSPGSTRPAPHPGPRCATHHREITKARRKAAHAKRVQKVYGLDNGQYETLYVHQGGVCAICQRATGKTKRLAVDHNHATGEVRGLLCGPCNEMLGRMRDDTDVFVRAIRYLLYPPARQVLKPSDQST